MYELVSEMLDMALERLSEEHSRTLHSDQVWHYQMAQYIYYYNHKRIKEKNGMSPVQYRAHA
ncbi:hypothetical protein GCM10020331_092330 [Ectobacillus funiculus]